MSEDIVAMARAAKADERLSDGALYGKLADEIERLLAKLAFVQAQMANDCDVDMKPCQPIEHCLCAQHAKERGYEQKRDAEIERLRNTLRDARDKLKLYYENGDKVYRGGAMYKPLMAQISSLVDEQHGDGK